MSFGKRRFLMGLFLAGFLALPGRLCAQGRSSVEEDLSVPPCHRKAKSAPSPQKDCERMICCLVMDMDRALSSVALPDPDNGSGHFVSLLDDSSALVVPPYLRGMVRDAGPPGRAEDLLTSQAPSRAPPSLA